MNSRLKNFLLSFTPILLLFGINILVSVLIFEIMMAYVFVTVDWSTITAQGLIRYTFKALFQDGFGSATMLVYGIAAFVTTAVWYRAFRKKTAPDFSVQSNVTEAVTVARDSLRGYNKPKLIIGLILCAAALQVVLTYLMYGIAILRPDWMIEYSQIAELSGISLETMNPMVAVYLIVGPVSEELAFRGLTYGYARRAFGFWSANIIQALLFGALHVIPIQAIMAFFGGLLIGYIYGKTKNILITIIFHLIFNGMSFVLDLVTFSTLPAVAFFFIILSCLIIVYLSLKLILSSVPVAKRKEDED